jgi:hypothetical protein
MTERTRIPQGWQAKASSNELERSALGNFPHLGHGFSSISFLLFELPNKPVDLCAIGLGEIVNAQLEHGPPINAGNGP